MQVYEDITAKQLLAGINSSRNHNPVVAVGWLQLRCMTS
jgi:hypothetical protein